MAARQAAARWSPGVLTRSLAGEVTRRAEKDGERARAQRRRNKWVMEKQTQGQGASAMVRETDPGSEPLPLALPSVTGKEPR